MLEATIILELVLGKFLEGAIIAALLLFNAALNFVQEGRAHGGACIAAQAAMPPGREVALPFGQMEASARAKLARLAQRWIDGKIRYEMDVAMRDPGREVLRIAKRKRVNLIVMATHGRKGLRRLILGSVVERIVREAPCPLLTIKPRSSTQGTAAASLKARA